MTRRTAVVAGGARGIGAGVITALHDHGMVVVCADVDDDHVHDGTAPAACLVVDVTDGMSCDSLVSRVTAAHGGIDVLVNCAGIVRRAPAADMSDADFDDVIDVNLGGAFRLARAAHPALVARQGCMVQLASTNGHVAVVGTASYCASKAGVAHLTRVLALEWAPEGIRVNAVAPTIVPTAMTADLRKDPDFMAAKLAGIPLGRMASVEDVAHAVRFLASDRAAMVTGQVLYVDGGATIH